jgi:hypothetical protein
MNAVAFLFLYIFMMLWTILVYRLGYEKGKRVRKERV